MPTFWFTSEASATPRTVEAHNLPEALLRLQDRGEKVTGVGAPATADRAAGRIPWRSLIAVYEQLAAMLEQGAPLDRGLRSMAAETRDRRLSASLRALATALEDGRSLAEAMAMQPRVYPPPVIAAVRAGEEAGDLAGALRNLAESQQAVAHIARGMAFPLIYPVLITLAALGIFSFVAAFIFPKFMQLFRDLGMEQSDFPSTTRFMMRVVGSIGWAWLVFAVIAAAVVAFWLAMRRTERGQFSFGLARLRVPIFGQVSIYTDLARVAATLSVLLRGGVDTVRALRLSRDAAHEPALDLALRRAGQTVADGGTIAEGLRDTALLPDEFVFRLGVAERDGTLPQTLERISEEYVRHADSVGRKWVVVSGPVVVIILAIIIGITVMSMFMPLVAIVNNLSG